MPYPSIASPLGDSERSSGINKHFAQSGLLFLVAQLTAPNELRAHPHRRHQLHFPRAECHILLRRRPMIGTSSACVCGHAVSVDPEATRIRDASFS